MESTLNFLRADYNHLRELSLLDLLLDSCIAVGGVL